MIGDLTLKAVGMSRATDRRETKKQPHGQKVTYRDNGEILTYIIMQILYTFFSAFDMKEAKSSKGMP